MELRMSFNDFIKIKSIFKINDLSGEVLDYTINNEEIKGVLGITGTYLLDDLKTNHTLSEEIPFNFVFANSDFTLNDVDCVNLEYELVDGRGLEINFDIILNYEQATADNEVREMEDSSFEQVDSLGEEEREINEKSQSVNTDHDSQEITDESRNTIEKTNENTSTIDDKEQEHDEKFEQSEFEEIKEKITNDINMKLENTLSYKNDNLPTEETFLSKIEERKTCIKVCYYNNDQDLEKICRNNNVSINHVFATNSNNNINNTRRVIIDEQS